MEEKKWFTKTAWSYIPSSLEGFLFLFGVALVFFLFLGIIKLAETAFDGVNLDILRATGFVVLFVATLSMARRHS